jgi:hypothetical protein
MITQYLIRIQVVLNNGKRNDLDDRINLYSFKRVLQGFF